VRGIIENVKELRATHSCRVLVQEHDGRLVIVDVGEHEIVDEFVAVSPKYRADQLAMATDALPCFNPRTTQPLFLEFHDDVDVAFAEELDSGWLWFLGDQQADAAQRIFDLAVAQSSSTKDVKLIYVRGGAGTGKTAILLNLALRLHDAGVPVEFRCSPALQKHLQQCTKINMSRLTRSLTRPGVLLVDDPPRPESVYSVDQWSMFVQARTVVVAFDALQWRSKFLRRSIEELPTPDADFALSLCYRQSENLGRQAMEIVAAIHDRSSWRSDSAKVKVEREVLKELEAEYLSGLSFVKTGGRTSIVEDGDLHAAVKAEAERLRGRFDLWTEMPSLLVLEDRRNDVKVPKAVRGQLAGVRFVTCDLNDVASYRGLDFQAVWIFMDEHFYVRIQEGKLGLSTADWEALRDLHVPFTRAKDEVVLFLVKPNGS
jgi:hypothetical protein